MTLPTRFQQLNLSSDGSNWSYLKAAVNNLEIKSAANVVVDAPLFYKNTSDVSTSLNATLDSFATSIATFVAQSYVDAADAALQSNIDSEASARSSAVTGLELADSTEAAARLAADNALDARITAIETLLIQLNSSTP